MGIGEISSNVKKKTVAIVGKNRLTDRTFRPYRASSAFRRREAIEETYNSREGVKDETV